MESTLKKIKKARKNCDRADYACLFELKVSIYVSDEEGVDDFYSLSTKFVSDSEFYWDYMLTIQTIVNDTVFHKTYNLDFDKFKNSNCEIQWHIEKLILLERDIRI